MIVLPLRSLRALRFQQICLTAEDTEVAENAASALTILTTLLSKKVEVHSVARYRKRRR